MWVTSKVSSNAAFASGGRLSTRATSPTWIMSTFDCDWLPKMPPKSTRNISGKTMAKNTDDLSRRKPRRIASDRARNGRAVRPPGREVVSVAGASVCRVSLMRGTPAR